MKNKLKYILCSIIAGISFTLAGISFAKPVNIAIVPFKINSQKESFHLQEGILDMLLLRISGQKEISVINREKIDSALKITGRRLTTRKLRSLGLSLNADYVISGIVTVFGKSMNIDAVMISTTDKNTFISEHKECSEKEDAIPFINTFAEKIIKTIINTDTASRQPELRTELQKFVSSESKFRKIRDYQLYIKGICIDDVDQDGKKETIIITPNQIIINRFERGKFYKIALIHGKSYEKFISVYCADIKKDGIPEIFVTSVNKSSHTLNSFVLQWNGKKFVKIVQKQNWYFKVLDIPSKGKVLLGQKRGISDIFFSGVYELKYQNNAYIKKSKLLLPAKANIFSFAFANIDKNTKSIVLFGKNEKISVFSDHRTEEWRSDEAYGGSEDFLEPLQKQDNNFFIPKPLLPIESNISGKYNILIVKHKSFSGRIFTKFRRFGNARFVYLQWDGMGFIEKLAVAQEIPGYVSDYTIGDINNNGKPDIAACVITKRSYPMQKPKSVLLIYEQGI